jgi:hypothetical protein
VERNYHYFLDKEGHFWHEGTEVTDPRFALTIHRSLKRTQDGKLVAKCQGENCFIEAEDVPYVVQDVAFHKDAGRLRQVDLLFSGGYMEILDPSTLRVSHDNVLYCLVRSGEFAARFTRKSFFKLAPFIGEDSENHRYYLEMKEKRFSITQDGTKLSEQ